MRNRSVPIVKRARGVTLLEALIALLVLSLGMLTMARLQTTLRLNSDIARQRSEAVRLAEEDMETLRAFASVAAGNAVKAYADISAANRSVRPDPASGGNVNFEIARQVTSVDDPTYKTASVSVNWTDRTGAAQRVALDSVIAANPPGLSAVLAISPRMQAVKGVLGRAVSVPVSATDLGNGQSVLKLDSSQTIAFVFSNASGRVVSVCSGVAAATRHMVAGDLASCTAMNGLLLSGQVRFSLNGAPDAAHANDTPLPLAVALALTGGPDPRPAQCGAQAMKTVAYSVDTSSRREAVPLLATAASWGVPSWTDLGERFVAYHCVVTPANTPARWSGRSTLLPQGWALGSMAGAYKVCRYSADQDGSGRVDSNAEHPDSYADVAANLTQQNFLVVKGDQSCPAGVPVNVDAHVDAHVDALQAQNFANLGTLQHQP